MSESAEVLVPSTSWLLHDSLCQHVDVLWRSGDGLSFAVYSLAGARHFASGSSRELGGDSALGDGTRCPNLRHDSSRKSSADSRDCPKRKDVTVSAFHSLPLAFHCIFRGG